MPKKPNLTILDFTSTLSATATANNKKKKIPEYALGAILFPGATTITKIAKTDEEKKNKETINKL